MIYVQNFSYSKLLKSIAYHSQTPDSSQRSGTTRIISWISALAVFGNHFQLNYHQSQGKKMTSVTLAVTFWIIDHCPGHKPLCGYVGKDQWNLIWQNT